MIARIRKKVADDLFEFSRHALDATFARGISVAEIREAIASGEVVEDYPNDKYGSSCLVSGQTRTGRPLHVQCSYPARPQLKIITLYEPDPSLWIDCKIRKK